MSLPSQQGTHHISTHHSNFTRPSPNLPPVNLLLRGVNLSSTAKYPPLPGWDQPSSSSSSNSTRDGVDGEDDMEDNQSQRYRKAGARSHLSEEEVGFWSEAENGGRDGWFVGRPLMMEEADVHLTRLRAYGFTTLRYLITWEALEHAGPGKYDEEFIDYTIALLRKCKEYGFRVFISPHQDVFSRFISGSGAPYWVLLAVGLNPRRLHQTGSAVLHSCWNTDGDGGIEGRQIAKEGKQGDWPDMIWNTNLHRLAARHCFTMFFASETFAPKCLIDGEHVGRYLRDHFNAAYGHLADRLKDAGGLLDECIIGWDSINEPSEGFIEIPDLNDFPPAQSFKKGASPTPIQGFNLGIGRSVPNIQVGDFTSLGQKTKGTITITPPDGDGAWLTRQEAKAAEDRWGWKLGSEWDFWDSEGKGGCIWAGHGVWDPESGNVERVDYFAKKPDGKEYNFINDFWKPHYESFISRIRKAHPEAISFVNPPVFEEPPDLGENVKNGRVALSSHFYDGLTLLAKRRHLFNADAVGLQRGLKTILGALKFGQDSIQSSLHSQLKELKSDAAKSGGIAGGDSQNMYPTIIGEIGIPFDMKKTSLFGLALGKDHKKDYRQVAKSMNEVMNACDGQNALSYTLWLYEPTNTHNNGDGWNGEDLSLISFDDTTPSDRSSASTLAERKERFSNPQDMSTLLTFGARAIESWCRPYPMEFMGKIQEFGFDMTSTVFTLGLDTSEIEVPPQSPTTADGPMEGYTLIYLPYVHYRKPSPSDTVSLKEEAKDSVPTPKAFRNSRRIVGNPIKLSSSISGNTTKNQSTPAEEVEGEAGEGGWEEWEKGQGGVRVDLEILEMDVGRLEVNGQFGKWIYPLDAGEIRLKLCKWRD